MRTRVRERERERDLCLIQAWLYFMGRDVKENFNRHEVSSNDKGDVEDSKDITI